MGWNSARPRPLTGTTGRQQGEVVDHRQERRPGRIGQRQRDDRVRDARLGDRALGHGLGPQQPGAAVGGRALGRAEDEVLDAGAAGRLHHAPRRDAVELLDRSAGLVARRAGEVHHRAHAAQRVAERRRVGQVAEHDLDAHALLAQPARVPDQAPDRATRRGQSANDGRADQPGGAGEQQHARGSLPSVI
jgi:hypothetical protein